MTKTPYTVVDGDTGEIITPCAWISSDPVADEDWSHEPNYIYHPLLREPNLVLDEWTGTEWIRSLHEAKKRKWDRVKELRDHHEFGTLLLPSGQRLQIDERSQARLSKAAELADRLARRNIPFQTSWTLEDNTEIPVDGQMLEDIGILMGMHVNAVFDRAKALRTLIDAATTMEEINAINVEEGWP